MALGHGENKYEKYGKPTLDLQFSGPKGSISNRADGGAISVEFTRTQDTQASYVKSDGTIGYASTDVARFDHDPVTGESLGLLIEESRTNYCRESAEVTNLNGSSPAVNGVRTVVSALLPDGTTGNCAQLYTNVVQDNYYIGAQGMPADTGFSASWWVKNTSGFEISFEYGRGSRTTITLPNDNKWHKIQFYAGTSNSIGQWYNLSLFDSRSNTTTNPSVTPITVLMWGLQVEAGSFPTSYIPTTGSTSTRGVDTASITGTNFSSWYNSSSEGSMFIDIKRPTVASSGAYLSFHNRSGYFLQDVSTNFILRIAGENSVTLGAYATTTDYKIASSYLSATEFNTSVNGSTPVSTSTSINFTNATELHIGRGDNSITAHYRNGPSNCHIRRLTFWPTRLSDSDLQSLTE